ncbi:MAG: AMIN domain-containing protein [Candidatus Aminicenantaceae bacterium]
MKKIFSLLFISTAILFVASTPEIYGGQEDQTVLEKLDLLQSEDSLKAVIGVSGEFGYQHFELNDPSRLVVEISPVGEIRTEESYDINAFGVKAVRTGRFKPDTARIVFDLVEALSSYEIIQVANGIEVVFRWTEDVDRVSPVTPRAIEQDEVPEEEVKKESHLKSISYGRRDGQLKVDIHIDGDFFYRTIELRHFSQLILDFWPVPVLSAESMKNINLSGLREITVQKTGPETARIVLDFSGMLSSFKIDRREGGLSMAFLSVEEQVRGPAAEMPEKKIIYKPIENSAATLTFGAYDVSDHVYDQIYNGNTLMFGFELSRIFARKDNHNFGVVLGANYYKDNGSSTLTKEESTFTLIPYYICLEYLWNQEQVIPFVRVGLNFMSYKEKSELHEVSGSSVGPQIALGIYIKVPDLEQMRLKFYFKWISATAEEEDVSLNIGGIEAGFGLTFGFNIL